MFDWRFPGILGCGAIHILGVFLVFGASGVVGFASVVWLVLLMGLGCVVYRCVVGTPTWVDLSGVVELLLCGRLVGFGGCACMVGGFLGLVCCVWFWVLLLPVGFCCIAVVLFCFAGADGCCLVL